MTVFVALLRAINVGKRQMPMAELRKLCEEIGFARPETYIASGNLIFDADGTAEKVRDTLEEACSTRFGFKVEIIICPAKAWAALRDANPFAGDPKAISKMVHLAMPREALKPGAVETIAGKAADGERVRAAGGALWIDYGENGVGQSKITPGLIDKAAGCPVTGRNWNTVLKLQDMIGTRK